MKKAVWKLSPQLWNADLESSAIFLTFAHQIILTHMSYPICFVSLGPGDPELITLKGLKKLRQADIIYCPATISKSGQLLSRAARIIKQEEQIIVIPGMLTAEELSKKIKTGNVIVIMKLSQCVEAVHTCIRLHPETNFHYFENVGTGEEFYTSDRKQIQRKIFPYLSLMHI